MYGSPSWWARSPWPSTWAWGSPWSTWRAPACWPAAWGPAWGWTKPTAPPSTTRRSNAVREGMDGDIQWVQTYVAGDRFFCVYNAESEDLIREHAARGGFPCDHVRQVGAVIDPVTAEQ
ncbi:DUF4242 domain-containing protein [Actinomadura sp.]|uniref:DUF4242 domain-containing protein n=1 Tax=Actinomadura sp. TaxID=1989 RepID=UPI003347C831